MKKKLPVLFALLLALAGSAQALDTDGLIALTAMPLAVADVTALPDVPQDEFISVVTTLNRAAVPAPQFIEVVRYAPVALVDTREPAFVTYVTQEYDRGIVGQPLAVAIADRYETVGIREVNVVNPPVVTLVDREILPPVVVTRFQTVDTVGSTGFEPLALIAMPLAVAAVADLVDVPRSDLITLISSLNAARVPAPQFVEVVRYSPVVLVDRTEAPQFVQFVTTEVDRGVIGRPLAIAVADRLRDTGADIDVVAPRTVVFEPVVAKTRVNRERVARAHPHGGPPGQLKKQRGLQTGAEVVHRERPRRIRVAPQPNVVAPPVVVARPKHDRPVHVDRGNRGGGRGHGNAGNAGGGGDGGGKGKGKGKGKG